MERSFLPAEVEYRWCQFWSKVMTSEEEERPMFVTGGYGRHRHQWVKYSAMQFVHSLFQEVFWSGQKYCNLRKQLSFFAPGPSGRRPSRKTPLGPGAKKDSCFRRLDVLNFCSYMYSWNNWTSAVLHGTKIDIRKVQLMCMKARTTDCRLGIKRRLQTF